MRPFMLYHWSPRSRRQSILHDGLCPRKLSPLVEDHLDKLGESVAKHVREWRPPYLCWCRQPSTAWALSATHSEKVGDWDLWCCWSDIVGPHVTVNGARKPKVSWWLTEWRTFERIPKKKLWYVGTRRFTPRKRPCP